MMHMSTKKWVKYQLIIFISSEKNSKRSKHACEHICFSCTEWVDSALIQSSLLPSFLNGLNFMFKVCFLQCSHFTVSFHPLFMNNDFFSFYLLLARDVHYGTFTGSGIFWNLYFESRISNPVSE